MSCRGDNLDKKFHHHLPTEQILHHGLRVNQGSHSQPNSLHILEVNNNSTNKEAIHKSKTEIKFTRHCSCPAYAEDEFQLLAASLNVQQLSKESYRQEHKTLLERICELEIDVAYLNLQRQEQVENQKRSFHEMETKFGIHDLTLQLRNALLRNAELLEENFELKFNQLTLSTRMSSLERKMKSMNPNLSDYDPIQSLETRESILKTQTQRVTQLESYYKQETEHRSQSGHVPMFEEIQTQDATLTKCPQNFTTKPSASDHHHAKPLPQPSMESRSYSELYYKSITDKAIRIIERETHNCNQLVNKLNKSSARNSNLRQGNLNPMMTPNFLQKHKLEQGEIRPVENEALNSVNSKEEEEILQELFFRF